jgi:hypothetical protein
LREFRERLRDIVGAPQLIPPHISLLYTLDRNVAAWLRGLGFEQNYDLMNLFRHDRNFKPTV